MGDEVYCFTCPGLATMVMHKAKASQILNVETNNKEDDFLETQKIAKKIKAEIKDLPSIKSEYPVLNEKTLTDTVIPTLNEILVSISSKFQTNPIVSSLISNIITTVVSSNVSMLQI